MDDPYELKDGEVRFLHSPDPEYGRYRVAASPEDARTPGVAVIFHTYNHMAEPFIEKITAPEGVPMGAIKVGFFDVLSDIFNQYSRGNNIMDEKNANEIIHRVKGALMEMVAGGQLRRLPWRDNEWSLTG